MWCCNTDWWETGRDGEGMFRQLWAPCDFSLTHKILIDGGVKHVFLRLIFYQSLQPSTNKWWQLYLLPTQHSDIREVLTTCGNSSCTLRLGCCWHCVYSMPTNTGHLQCCNCTGEDQGRAWGAAGIVSTVCQLTQGICSVVTALGKIKANENEIIAN